MWSSKRSAASKYPMHTWFFLCGLNHLYRCSLCATKHVTSRWLSGLFCGKIHLQCPLQQIRWYDYSLVHTPLENAQHFHRHIGNQYVYQILLFSYSVANTFTHIRHIHIHPFPCTHTIERKKYQHSVCLLLCFLSLWTTLLHSIRKKVSVRFRHQVYVFGKSLDKSAYT